MAERGVDRTTNAHLGSAMKVFKFGGASVKDAAGVRNVAEVVKRYGLDDLVIVVSAMGKTTNALEEVVVTALGIKKDDKKLGYAVTTVKGDEIARTNTINPITALQGKVAGVNINVMTANGVQSSPSIIIRGSKVLGNQPGQSNNQPIFVVDGNVLTNNQSDADNTDAGSQLKNLNPDDYESITILKGAAATAIYGSRGLNGAVVITTKKGKANSGLGIEYTTTYQKQDIYKSPIAYQNVFFFNTHFS